MGWKIVGTIDADIKKCVMMVCRTVPMILSGNFTRGTLEMNFVAEIVCFSLGWYSNTWEES
jgi:hypothetical protein